MNLPLYRRELSGSGTHSPLPSISSTTSPTTLRIPRKAPSAVSYDSYTYTAGFAIVDAGNALIFGVDMLVTQVDNPGICICGSSRLCSLYRVFA